MPPKLSPNHACKQCKKRKIKCDGVQPRCGLCIRLNKECFFQNEHKTRTEILEARVRDLERELEMAEKGPFRSHILTHKLWNVPHAQSLLPSVGSSSATTPTERQDKPLMIAFYPHLDDPPWFPLTPEESIGEGERYPSVIPQRTMETILKEWDATAEVPAPLKNILVRTFLPHRHHFNFHFHVPTFLQDVHRPPEDPRSIHPSLLNAIYLLATVFASPSGNLKPYTSNFLNRTRQHIQASLAYATKLLHSLWAQSLLSAYYARSSRVPEAYTELSGAIRMAVAFGLHRMGNQTSEWNPDGRTPPEHPEEAERVVNVAMISLLPEPTDELEAAERVHLWWALYLADISMWLIYGQPRNVIEEDVTTNWPQSLLELRQRLSIDPPAPLGEPSPDLIPLSTVLTLKVKILNIIAKIRKLAFTAKSPSVFSDWSDEHTHVSTRLAEFHAGIPSYDNGRGLYAIKAKDITNPSLFWVALYAYSADMIFHNILASEREEEYELVLIGAIRLSQVMRDEMRMGAKYTGGQEVVTPIHAPYVLMGCASIAVEVLAREIRVAAALLEIPSTPSTRSTLPTEYYSSPETFPRPQDVLPPSPSLSDSSSLHASSLPASGYSSDSTPNTRNTTSKHSIVSHPGNLRRSLKHQTKKERLDNAHASLESLLTNLWEFSYFCPSWAEPLRRLRKAFMDVPEYETI